MVYGLCMDSPLAGLGRRHEPSFLTVVMTGICEMYIDQSCFKVMPFDLRVQQCCYVMNHLQRREPSITRWYS